MAVHIWAVAPQLPVDLREGGAGQTGVSGSGPHPHQRPFALTAWALQVRRQHLRERKNLRAMLRQEPELQVLIFVVSFPFLSIRMLEISTDVL